MVGECKNKYFIGHLNEEKIGILNFVYPIEYGMIYNSNDMKQIGVYIYK
jgi:hypothetical protein